MSPKNLKKLAYAIYEEMTTFDDEMVSVFLMKKFKASPEEYVQARYLLNKIVKEKLDNEEERS